MKILFVGGTGFISAAVSRLVLARGWKLFLLNRGQRHPNPPGCRSLAADINRAEEARAALGDLRFDVIVDWVAHTPDVPLWFKSFALVDVAPGESTVKSLLAVVYENGVVQRLNYTRFPGHPRQIFVFFISALSGRRVLSSLMALSSASSWRRV